MSTQNKIKIEIQEDNDFKKDPKRECISQMAEDILMLKQ
jgi:hypothetical protein